MAKHPQRILVIFNTMCLYGMERSVIETFELLRPETEPIFLIPRSSRRYKTPLFTELETRGLTYRFFSDYWDWPRVGKPRGLLGFLSLSFSILLANLNVLRHSISTDFLYLPVWTSALYSLIGAAVFRLRGKKVIYFFHDLMSKPSQKVSLAAAISTDLVHYADYSHRAVRNGNPLVNTKRNHVIPPAIELREDPAIDVRPFARKRNFVFIGQVSLHKGIDLLAEAFKQVSKSHGEVELHIIGGCDSRFQEQFQNLVAGCHNIESWGYRSGAHTLLANAFAYVHPSPPSRFNESFGRGAVEAMACGVPVISFASGALTEIVQHGLNGLLCREETAKCLAEQMTSLLVDQTLRDRLADGARRLYAQKYSNAIVKQGWLDLLGVPPGPLRDSQAAI